MSLIDEYYIRAKLRHAKSVSFSVAKGVVVKNTSYEVDNAFSRLVISMVNLNLDKTRGIVIVLKDTPEEAAIFDKWEEELRSKNITPHRRALIHSLNTYKPKSVPTPHINLERSIIPRVMERLRKRYSMHNPTVNEAELRKAIELMYVRYVTYESWSQCWTYVDQDFNSAYTMNPNIKNIELFGASFNARASTYWFGSLFPDVDAPFGGIATCYDLLTKIERDNKNKISYNIFINPPYTEPIMKYVADNYERITACNNVVIMYPTWEDNESYQYLKRRALSVLQIIRAQDMWTDKIISHVKSTFFIMSTSCGAKIL